MDAGYDTAEDVYRFLTETFSPQPNSRMNHRTTKVGKKAPAGLV